MSICLFCKHHISTTVMVHIHAAQLTDGTLPLAKAAEKSRQSSSADEVTPPQFSASPTEGMVNTAWAIDGDATHT